MFDYPIFEYYNSTPPGIIHLINPCVIAPFEKALINITGEGFGTNISDLSA
jgi:hypothetical protein